MKKVRFNSVITIRMVANGWIVHSMGGQGDVVAEPDDTLVFNHIEDLCDGLRTLYKENVSESD